MISPQYNIYEYIEVTEDTGRYRRCIEISASTVSVILYDKYYGKICGLESWNYSENIQKQVVQILAESKLYALPIPDTHVYLLFPAYSHIPVSLFIPDRAKDYLSFTICIDYQGKIRTDYFNNDKDVCVYSIPDFLNEEFLSKNIKSISHFSTLLFKECKIMNADTTQEYYVYVHENNFEALVIKSGNLQLYNTYTFHSANEFLYFILLLLKQTGSDTEDAKLCVMGGIEDNSQLMNILNKYVRYVKRVAISYGLLFPEAFDDVPKKRFDMLFKQCIEK